MDVKRMEVKGYLWLIPYAGDGYILSPRKPKEGSDPFEEDMREDVVRLDVLLGEYEGKLIRVVIEELKDENYEV